MIVLMKTSAAAVSYFAIQGGLTGYQSMPALSSRTKGN